MTTIRITLAALALSTLGAPALFAQDGPLLPPFLQQQNDPKQEMAELFKKVERRLNEIDKLLYDAAAGNARLDAQAGSGIAELLQQSQARGQEVVSGIDRILEIAKQSGGGT